MNDRVRWLIGTLAVAALVGCGPQTPGGGGGGTTSPSPQASSATDNAMPGGTTNAGGTSNVNLPPGFFEGASRMITITGTGSPDYQGFQLEVAPDGRVLVPDVSNAESTTAYLPPNVISQFINDLSAALPVESLPQGNTCVPSRWGSDYGLMVSLGGAPSPNLLCASDARSKALQVDVLTIMNAVGYEPHLVNAAPLNGPDNGGPKM